MTAQIYWRKLNAQCRFTGQLLFVLGISYEPYINRIVGKKNITKTYLYNIDPLKPHFYIVKLGLQGYTLFFLLLLKNIDCGYSLEPPRRGGSNEYLQSMF